MIYLDINMSELHNIRDQIRRLLKKEQELLEQHNNVNPQLEEVNDDLDDLDQRKNEQRKERHTDRLKLLKEKHPTVFRIRCHRTSNTGSLYSAVSHDMCSFSTRDKALQHAPECSTWEGFYTWHYEVVQVKATNKMLEELDQPPPYYFPYYGIY